jgi:[ribosomal protein S5]-alanine N-acetyltransferase
MVGDGATILHRAAWARRQRSGHHENRAREMMRVNPIHTERLTLVPTSLAHLDAELESCEALARLLGVRLPASWPPGEYDRSAIEFFRARLAENPRVLGWYGWYAIDRDGGVVVGAAGYLGPPSPDGTLEVGYSIAPEFQARGYATEIVQALVDRAWSVPEVRRIIAHTQRENLGSVKVLERAGFKAVDASQETGAVEYERLRTVAY